MGNTKNTDKFIAEINILSGIAILLVVIGHLPFLGRTGFYGFFRSVIYSFHMPLFMTISGFLFARFSKDKIVGLSSYLGFLLKKVYRFCPPYIILTTLLFLVKIVAGKVFVLKHPVNFHSFFMMFVNPMQGGFVVHLWFIYALFIIFVLYPVLEKISCKIDSRWKLLLYWCLSCVPMPYLFCLNLVFKYMVYFHFGCLISEYGRMPSRKKCFYGSVVFCILFFGFNELRNLDIWILGSGISILVCLLGMASVVCFSSIIAKQRTFLNRFFSLLGVFSFEIFLLHTLGSEAFSYYIVSLHLPVYLQGWIIAIGGTCCGIFVPIMIFSVASKLFPKQAAFAFGRK